MQKGSTCSPFLAVSIEKKLSSSNPSHAHMGASQKNNLLHNADECYIHVPYDYFYIFFEWRLNVH